MKDLLKIKFNLNIASIRSVAVYIFTNFFSKGIAFLLIPLFTNPAYLTPKDNGVLSIFSSYILLLTPFLTLGMVHSTTAEFFKKNKEDFATSNTSNIIIGFVFMIIGMAGLYLFKDYLLHRFDFPVSFVFILPFIVFLTFFNEQLSMLIRNRNEINIYAATNITKAIIEYGLAVVLIVFFYKAWHGRVWSIAVSLVVLNLFGVWYYFKNGYWRFNFKFSYFLEELRYGVPIIAFQMAVFLLGATNKLFLAFFNVDKHELGIYAIASILGALIGSLSQSIFLFVQPRVYKIISSGKATPEVIKKEFFRFVLLLSLCSIACIGVVVLIYYFFINPLYFSGMPYFFIIALSSFIWGLNSFFFNFLLYQKAKKKIFALSIASVCFSMLVNIVMVKNFLILGDALSGLINTLIFSLLLYIICRKTILNTITHNQVIITDAANKIEQRDSNYIFSNSQTKTAPIVYFAYNRPEHTQKTLQAISECRNAENTVLYIYIDGPKAGASEETINNINEVKKIAVQKNWCGEVHINIAEKNKGLFKSIVQGVTETVNKHGKVIVIEDDVLIFPGFLNYMNNALDMYEHTPEVMHISAFTRAEFAAVPLQDTTFFYNHTTCWGWATWKRAWDKFTPDPLAIKKACAKKGNIHYLDMDGTTEIFWGLKAIADGKFQSWNTLWHSVVFLNNGLCLHPARSLVSNIGHDGSGTNCEPDDEFGKNEFMQEDIEIKRIPLIENKLVRDYNTHMHGFRHRVKFALKHYLRYLIWR